MEHSNDNVMSDYASMGGMLCDVGTFVLATSLPSEIAEAQNICDKQDRLDWDMESLPKRSDKSIEDLSRMFGAKIQGWINYYGRFYRSQIYMTLRHINRKLVSWAMRKYKKLYRHPQRAEHWLGRVAENFPSLFPHWRMGLLPTVG
ncbi:MAG: hypothetical protein ACI82O_002024 [Patiriisocius sp.]|jgi:hypothetical protein